MRRVLKNHHEVCHFWANQIQDSGKASNMFYERDIIYSYGYHFPIAKHIKDGLIFAAVAKIFQFASDKAADFVSGMPEDEYEEYEDNE